MSDRPRRALADDEEPEEIPEVRFVEESAIPARRAAGSEDVSDLFRTGRATRLSLIHISEPTRRS